MQTDLTMSQKRQAPWGWPLFMSFVRLPLILMGNGAVILALRLAGFPVGISSWAAWSTLSLTLVNLVCLALLRWRARVEGLRLDDVVGFKEHEFFHDLGWGLLWSMVLFALMMVGFLATTFAIQGMTGLTFERIHVGNADYGMVQ